MVDPIAEIDALPPGLCGGYDNHYVMSANAVRALLINERNAETQHAADLVGCQGAALVAESKQRQAETALESAGWWRNYGLLVSVTSLFVGAALGGAFGAAYGRATR